MKDGTNLGFPNTPHHDSKVGKETTPLGLVSYCTRQHSFLYMLGSQKNSYLSKNVLYIIIACLQELIDMTKLSARYQRLELEAPAHLHSSNITPIQPSRQIDNGKKGNF